MCKMLLSTEGQKLVFARQPPQHIITDDLTLVIRILHAHSTSMYQKNSTRKFLGCGFYDPNMNSTKALKQEAQLRTGILQQGMGDA